jgi:hypothetical protein
MSSCAVTLLTYVWHYVVARLLYDDLVRPLISGSASAGVFALGCLLVIGLTALALVRRRR